MIKALSNTFGVSGLEDKVRETIINEISPCDVKIDIDNMGNLFVRRMVDDKLPTIALFAHMDEPGFIITDITEDGYLKFDIICSIYPNSIVSKRVKIGNIIGIISLKAIHLTTKEERKNLIKIEDLFIDIGTSCREEAMRVVEIGDYCSFASSFSNFGDNSFKGKALSSRASCSVLIDIIKEYKPSNANLICVFTTQKEISSRGALTALNSLNCLDYAILIDGIGESIDNDKIKLGRGPVFAMPPNDTDMSISFINDIKKYADNIDLKYQVDVTNLNGDINALKSNCSNIPAVVIGIPCKNINTPSEIVCKSDIDSTYKIIKEVLEGIEK